MQREAGRQSHAVGGMHAFWEGGKRSGWLVRARVWQNSESSIVHSEIRVWSERECGVVSEASAGYPDIPRKVDVKLLGKGSSKLPWHEAGPSKSARRRSGSGPVGCQKRTLSPGMHLRTRSDLAELLPPHRPAHRPHFKTRGKQAGPPGADSAAGSRIRGGV